MQSSNQRNTLVRNSVIGGVGVPVAGLSGASSIIQQQQRTSNGVIINPGCDCPKCRRAARMMAKGPAGVGSCNGNGKPISTSTRVYTGTGSFNKQSRSKSPLAFKTKLFPSVTNGGANFDDGDEDYADGDGNGDGDPESDQLEKEYSTKFVLTPRKMVYTPPPQPQQPRPREPEQDSRRYDAGDCHHSVEEPCCMYCRAKLSGSEGRGSRLIDRKRTAVISKARAFQPVYSTPTCTYLHDDMPEDTPRPRPRRPESPEQNGDGYVDAEGTDVGADQELEDQNQNNEPYDEEGSEDSEGDGELEILVKPQLQPQSGNGQVGATTTSSHENPIRSRYRYLQQQESRLHRVSIPSRYMTDLQTRIEKSINIYVYRNGIESLPPALIHIPPARKQNMRAVISVIQDRMKYPIGYAKTLYKMDGTVVRHPCELELYEKYVVGSSYQKAFQPVEYGRVRSPLMILGNESKNIHVRSKRSSYEDWWKKWKQNGLGKGLLPAEDARARSREIVEKPHNVKTCIPVKLPGPSPRVSVSLREAKTRDDIKNNRAGNGKEGTFRAKGKDHSSGSGRIGDGIGVVSQTKSEPLNWTQKKERLPELNGDVGVGTNGEGDGNGIRAASSYVKPQQEMNLEHKHKRRSGQSHLTDKFFCDSKMSQQEVPRPQPPAPAAPAAEPSNLKDELLDDDEPEIIDDDIFLDSGRKREKPQPQPSESYTTHSHRHRGPIILPSAGAAANELTPCFSAFLRPTATQAAAASPDFSLQHAFQMQYILATWFQLPVSDASFQAERKVLECKSKGTSTSDIPVYSCCGFGGGSSMYRTIREREREIPEVQIPFTPPLPRQSSSSWKASLSQPHSHSRGQGQVSKRNVAIQMGASALVFTGAEHENQKSCRNNANAPNQHHQFQSPQIVLLVPPQETGRFSNSSMVPNGVSSQHMQQQQK